MTVITGFITPFRKDVADLIEHSSVPVYGYLPDDVAHLPCHVVGRPSIRESITKGVMTLSLDVTLLGRRINDEDSQLQLDALGDELFITLGGTRSVRQGESVIRCTNFNPGTVIVAGLECPAYIATVSIDAMSC